MTILALVADHLWQSTLFAGVAALLVRALRSNHARVRYWLWLAASIKFVIPFTLLVAIGSLVGWRTAPSLPSPELALVMDAVSEPFSAPDIHAGAATASGAVSGLDAGSLQITIVALWFVVCAALLVVWAVRWRRVAAIVRGASRVEDGTELRILRRLERLNAIGRPLPLVSSEDPHEPGVFGIVRPVLLWPRHISARLTDEQIEAVLAHELSHVRRRDNLAAAFHAFVQAVFWFHPLVWWLGGQLVHERELACDAEVIRTGGDPLAYAESILKTCEFCIESPLTCVAGVTGSDLKRRIEAIMRGRIGNSLNFWKSLLLATAALLAVGTPVVVGILHAPPLRAQTPAAAAQNPAFEVASVKPNKSGDGNARLGSQPGGRFVATNVSVRMLLRSAYQLQDFQLVGGPGWIDSERFDIIAKADGNLPPPVPGGPPAPEQFMLRTLLAERFKLVMREDTRELPIYALVPARSDGRLGPQLRRSDVDCAAMATAVARGAAPPAVQPGQQQPCHMRSGPGRISGGGFALSRLTAVLSQLLQRGVMDRTGLAGNFDVDLTWTPDHVPPEFASSGAPPIDPNGPSIFAALQEQLGLKLDSQKGPVTVLVIDRIERPDPD